jgi:hypothetical protein
MNNENSGNGMFAVELLVESGPRVEARLTGEYFRPDEIGLAKAVAINYWSASVANGGSPVYLVKDSVVRLAMMSRDRALRAGLSECTSGTRQEPCGDCEECRNAEKDAFTRVILGAIELPQCRIAEDLREAVSSVIGFTWADAPWDGAMTDEEVADVFDELGIEDKIERN